MISVSPLETLNDLLQPLRVQLQDRQLEALVCMLKSLGFFLSLFVCSKRSAKCVIFKLPGVEWIWAPSTFTMASCAVSLSYCSRTEVSETARMVFEEEDNSMHVGRGPNDCQYGQGEALDLSCTVAHLQLGQRFLQQNSPYFGGLYLASCVSRGWTR